jgi:hypothetical protein
VRPRQTASAGANERLEDEGEVMMVRRSRVTPFVTCGLCSGILHDATTVSECLHSCEPLPPSVPASPCAWRIVPTAACRCFFMPEMVTTSQFVPDFSLESFFCSRK